MLFKKLLRTALSYKSQFISMIVMTAIGIGVFLGFNIEWHSIENNTTQFFEDTAYADFRVYDEKGFSKEAAERIEKLDCVEAATRYLSLNVGIKDTKKSVTLNVSEDYNVSTMVITDGAEYDSDSDGIWMSDRFAKTNDIKTGDEITLIYNGIEIKGRIAGLCKSSENMICVADSNQLMPDYSTHGFVYISPKMLEEAFGMGFYPQINIISDAGKADIEHKIDDVLGKTVKVVEKDLHSSYAGALSETEEGKTMGAVLPVLFLAIAILTMVTTMHRIAANEKVQIGTLKALGFRDLRIIRHYTSYGLFIGVVGSAAGVILGYGVAALIMSPHGMMSTYFDMPNWKLTMPEYCIPIIVAAIMLLTLISFLSTKAMLVGTAADALRPYVPKAMKKSFIERFKVSGLFTFLTKWNIRDIGRHKTRSAMTLLGVTGCTLLMVAGLGMRDTMKFFINMLDEGVNNYVTKITVSNTAANDEAGELCDKLGGDWQADVGISYGEDTISLSIYDVHNDKIRFLREDNSFMELGDDGVYLCLRQKDSAKIGDMVEISVYGSETAYKVRVAGYYRSLFSEGIIMSDRYADSLGIDYHINSIYTDVAVDDIGDEGLISSKQDKKTIMDSYEAFMSIMNTMVMIFIVAAVILGIVVLYNLGIMSYVERRRELATLKVLGFRDKAVAKLLISQNLWLTLCGILIGLPCGFVALDVVVTMLAAEYELTVTVSLATYIISTLLTLGVSLLVGLQVAGKNKKIDMVEALKDAE